MPKRLKITCIYCEHDDMKVDKVYKDKGQRKVRCNWCGAIMHYTLDDDAPEYISTKYLPAQCYYQKEKIANSIDNFIEEQKEKLNKPKLKFKKKISNKEEQDMKVRELAVQQNMPVETYTSEQGFIPTWQYEVLDEESRLNELAKEAAEKESALNWDLIQAGFPITTKCKIQED